MRYAEIEKGRVRYVLPAELADAYTILPPNAVMISQEDDISEGDIYEVGIFREKTEEDDKAEARTAFDCERKRLFAETAWARERHGDRLELGIDDKENWTAWLAYWQALRDIPQQEDKDGNLIFDPRIPAWPVKPK